MFPLRNLISCGGVLLLHPSCGKVKSLATSWEEPGSAHRLALSSVACPPPTHLVRLGCYQQLSHPRELGLGIHNPPGPTAPGQCPPGVVARTSRHPGHRQPVDLLASMRGGLGPGHRGSGSAAAPRKASRKQGPSDQLESWGPCRD